MKRVLTILALVAGISLVASGEVLAGPGGKSKGEHKVQKKDRDARQTAVNHGQKVQPKANRVPRPVVRPPARPAVTHHSAYSNAYQRAIERQRIINEANSLNAQAAALRAQAARVEAQRQALLARVRALFHRFDRTGMDRMRPHDRNRNRSKQYHPQVLQLIEQARQLAETSKSLENSAKHLALRAQCLLRTLR